MTGMTPEEAESFYEDDEDPHEVFDWFDQGPYGVTTPASGVQQPPSAEVVERVLASGLYARLRDELLPEVSVTYTVQQWTRQA